MYRAPVAPAFSNTFRSRLADPSNAARDRLYFQNPLTNEPPDKLRLPPRNAL